MLLPFISWKISIRLFFFLILSYRFLFTISPKCGRPRASPSIASRSREPSYGDEFIERLAQALGGGGF